MSNSILRGDVVFSMFREKGPIIRKLLGYQFASAVMGVLLSSSAAQVKWLNLLTSIFATVFYCALIYAAMWELGAKDRIKADGGRLAYEPKTGLVCALGANIPNLILGLIIVIFTAIAIPTQMEWAGNVVAVVAPIARLWQGMYNGIIVYLVPLGLKGGAAIFSTLIYIAITLPAFAVCFFAYLMGFKNKKIFRFGTK